MNKIFNRNKIKNINDELAEDIINNNKDSLIADISQRRGLVINSGLTRAERDYILSDSVISSAIQLYIADIKDICKKRNFVVTSDITINSIVSKEESTDNDNKLSKESNEAKKAKVEYVFNKIYSLDLIESIAINLLNNGEVFLNTKYNSINNKFVVNETSYSRCTELCYANNSTACYIASNEMTDNSGTGSADVNNIYSYNLSEEAKNDILSKKEMVRIYNPTFINSKTAIELKNKDIISKIKENYEDEFLYYKNSQSILKQVYPDWLNSKLLELAVYRDRIAKSRFIQLIALELGKTSRETSDNIYDNVKDYFDKRAVIDLDQQTFKSVVGNEPFVEYKVYTTREGAGKLTFDNTLNGNSAEVSILADLEYNQNKVFAGLGVPKQFLTADDNGSALSNGGSLFFMSEKYQKRVLAYVNRISQGLKQVIVNLIEQMEGNEYLQHYDFNIECNIPESNEEIYRTKQANLDYVNGLLDLVEKIKTASKEGIQYSVEELEKLLQENISKLILDDVINVDDNNEESEEII